MTGEERQALLAEIKGIRVTDWHDAMDALGLHDRGLMSPDIRPLWRDFEDLSHCISGFAFTLRVVPSSNAIVARDVEDYRRQVGEWYAAELRWPDELTPGDLVVVDASVSRDCGLIGSYNSLQWLAKGAVGIVSSGGARDTDEVIKQRVPVYCREFARGISPGRIEYDSMQQPVECGGVYVHPGDLVIADGDGVIVIPAARVADALPIARDIVSGDQKGRAALYEQLGLPPDFTLGDAAP